MSFNPFAGGGGGGLPADVKFAVNLTITSEGYTYTFQLYDQNGDPIGDAVELILPEPMVFKGTVGTGGTISTLPTDGSAVVGWTYKVIEDGTYDSQAAKVGDTFICLSQTDNANTWVYIPSGDEPSGTVTNVAVGAGLVTADGNPITSSGTIKVKIQNETKLGGTAATVVPGSFNTNIWPVLLDQSGNLAVKINKTDIGLNNVTNDAQVKKIVSSTNGNIMTWSGTTGDTPADSGVSIETTFSSTSDTKIPTSKSVATELAKKYVKKADEYNAGKTVPAGTTVSYRGQTYTVESNAEIFNNYNYNIATGMYSHAEGASTAATSYQAHAEGAGTWASGMGAHAEGAGSVASGANSHAEGASREASGSCSHAEGGGTLASGSCSHAEGGGTIAGGTNSHAEGASTIASSDFQHAEGKWNVEDANNKFAHIIGNGTSDNARSNAYAIDWDGKIYTHNSATGFDINGNYLEMPNGIRLYISATTPTGDIPDGSLGVGW